MPGGRLGCGANVDVFIVGQCGRGNLGLLKDITSIEFTRVLDDVSEARIVVGVGGGFDTSCCSVVQDIHPWCHEIQIVRDGETIWEGPVTNIEFSINEVVIEARDVLAWLSVRVAQGVLDTAGTPTEITDLALDTIEAAFSEHNPCVVEYVYQTDLVQRPTPFNETEVGAEQFPAYEGTYLDWLFDLSEIGLDFTVLGRRIILGAEGINVPTIGTLTEEHFLSDIKIARDGLAIVNRMFVRYQGDDTVAQCDANRLAGLLPAATATTVPCPAVAEADNFFCYGPIERISSEALDFNVTSAQQTAEAYVRAGSGSPMTADFPEGARLAPDTPFEINEIIPGGKIVLAVSFLCIPVHQEFQIVELRYRFDSSGLEEIALTMGEYDSIATKKL